jgi:phenylalanyl-tRNA synthetase beta chain
MLVSLRWLKDYVDIDLSPQELADRLTMAGLEVDAIRDVRPDIKDIVVAKILSVRPHPNADKLSLCEVTTGDRTYPVVCGAPNVRAGDAAPLAKVGASLPGGYTIKSTRIRGEQSEGMLCSEEEMGIGPDASGIMILPADLRLGEDLVSALDLGDTVFDVGVTPNRSDCLSIIGIAREVAAITGKKIHYPEIRFEEAAEDIGEITSVDIIDPELCPRYAARVVKGVRIGPSPRWMRIRLEAVGLRPISNVVDVTNFVMMEFGQPLHAFDFRYLEEGRIVVRGARDQEEFISLDGKSRLLKADTLMICDGVKPVAIAGIMGGLNSEIQDDTETVLLESAYFNPSSIRKTARTLGMSTDAAFRFERGIDPEGVLRALDRAAQLVVETAGGKICRNRIDNYPRKIASSRDIPLRVSRVRTVLGAAVQAGEMKKILKSLEMSVVRSGKDYRVTPPSFRVDISREIDLIEEVARLRGYGTIPESIPPIPVQADVKDRKKVLAERVRAFFNGCGFSEVINYSFTAPGSADVLAFRPEDERRRFVRIVNPLTDDQSVMRTTLLYGLLQTMKTNVNNGCVDLKFFEQGKIFIADAEDGLLPKEREMIGALITGARYDNLWHSKGLPSDFYDLKGCVENLFEALNMAKVSFQSAVDATCLHPGRACRIVVGDREAGVLGEIHPDVVEKMDLKRRAVVFELDFDLLAGHFTDAVITREIQKFPSSSRDVAFLIDRDVEAEKILGLARTEKEELLEKIEIFDVYIGKSIPDHMKSIALRFTYRSPGKTLTDEEVARAHGRIVERITGATGAKIRGEQD